MLFILFCVFVPKIGVAQQLPMLYAVLFVHTVCEYAGIAVENLFFFGGGKKREGKSSFAVFGFAVGGADCKCAFSCGAGVLVCIMNFIGRIVR